MFPRSVVVFCEGGYRLIGVNVLRVSKFVVSWDDHGEIRGAGARCVLMMIKSA